MWRMETQPHPQGIPTQSKTSGMAIASLACGILSIWLGLPALLGIIFGIIALRQINGSAGVITGTGLAIGGLVTSALGMIVIFAMLLPELARAKQKAPRIMCMNNLRQVGIAGVVFMLDNDDRLPWQLDANGVLEHFDPTATASDQYGTQINLSINEVKAHPNSLAAAGVFGLTAMKREIMTSKILLSPCDPSRAAANEIVLYNWHSYDTKAKGVSAELGRGASYVLVRGADALRPSSVYALTRNWSTDNLNMGKWLGSDSDRGNKRTMADLHASQGQVVFMDGSTHLSSNADFGGAGMITRAQSDSGGVAKGQTSLNLIRGPGLD